MSKQDLDETLRRLANEPTYSAYTATANALEGVTSKASHLPPLRVAILRNFTIEPMIPVIKGEIALAGFYPVIYLGDYDAVARDALDPDSALYAFQPDFVVMAQWLETLAPTLVTRFLSLSPEQVNDEVDRVLTTLAANVTALRQHSKAPILLNNFPLPMHTTLGILDSQSEQFQTQTILRLNLQMLRYARQWGDAYLVDYLALLARIGSQRGIDERHWQMAHAPLSSQALVPVGQEYAKFIRALRGSTRKCLVLDCDNTLWGGIVGEDGIAGIQIGTTYPGSCYQAIQREVLNLHDRGVILALCSKNNEADVLEVFHSHPDMILREAHCATWQINWDDKVTNLTRIAQELNIGLDSLVLVDDSAFECNLVREQLPQVEVVQLSTDPSAFVAQLSVGAYFDSLTLSAEDRERNQMYRDETSRKQLQSSATSLEEYLTKLELVAEIGVPNDLMIPRISQLTQKTNQFNLTTQRYGEGEIREFAGSPDSDVFYLKLRDRISDLGIIGAAIVRYAGERAKIDSFLLSCRAIGRGAEEALLAHLQNIARARGCA
ncbi:MAG: HAD-IIIC family phosphatase, partial [Chloroflexi bacterium]|nr:HAD-IIIC family phosphatase [Chloroflexota bacterium]